MLGALAGPSMRLVTIRVSHYNERARWALDRLGVRYVEEPYMPMLHVPAVVWATRGRGGKADRVSTRMSTPVLVTGEGPPLCDSGEILRWADARFGTPETTLYPAPHRDAIEAFEAAVHDDVGPHTRRLAYFVGLSRPEVLERLAERNVGRRQAWLFRRMYSVVMAGVSRGLKIDAAHAERSLEKLRVQVQALAPRMEGRRYLFGDRFTAADLSLACMFAPVLLPSPAEGYGATLPGIDELPPEGRELVEEMRATPVGAFCLRMFAHERRRA
jgi:glutathione S-transferase